MSRRSQPIAVNNDVDENGNPTGGANVGESSGPEGGPVVHAVVVEVSWDLLGEILGIKDAGGLVLAAHADMDGILRLLVQHPHAPPSLNGRPYASGILEQTVTTCEHGGIMERKTRLVFAKPLER